MKCVCDFQTLETEAIGNRFGSLSFWYLNGTTPDERMWFEWAEEMPEGWLKQTYPWLEEMQIYAVSGGATMGYPLNEGDVMPCEFTRDCFKDPSDRSVLDDYDFSKLVRACGNMLRQGVKPCLKLHAVPIKYSCEPKIGWFRVNCRPPDDYEVYANYISALAQAMVDEFGKEEVARWRWFVGTEMENPMWWEAADETAGSTKVEYFKFHDWSVFALERVLGDALGPIGTHAMMAGEYTGGAWDPEEFMTHCASGTNYATGQTGSRFDFFALSYYDRSPVHLETDEWQTNLTGDGGDMALFDGFVKRTREALDRQSFTDCPIEVSEGGMLFGSDGKWMWHGVSPGGMFDATWTAWSFWKMLENGTQRWSRWPLLRTRGLFQGPESTSTHALRMIAELKEDARASVEMPPDDRLLRVIAGAGENKVHLLVLHHAVDMSKPTETTKLEIELNGLPFNGPVQITKTLLDNGHGDFWPQWEKDRASQGITDKDYFRSRDQIDVAHALTNVHHKAVWAHFEKGYEPLARFPEAKVIEAETEAGSLTLNCTVPPLSVILFEAEVK
jgi:hypothetical protein